LLPSYSPELNTVGRFWNYIIKNKVYDSLEQLHHDVAQFMNTLKTDNIKNICSAKYLID